jgi:hypothetical protein
VILSIFSTHTNLQTFKPYHPLIWKLGISYGHSEGSEGCEGSNGVTEPVNKAIKEATIKEIRIEFSVIAAATTYYNVNSGT